MRLPIRAFLESLRKSALHSVEQLATLLKSLDSGVRSFDDVIHSMKLTKDARGLTRVGGETVGYLDKTIRAGNLPELIRMSERKVPFTSADTKAFQSLVEGFPQNTLHSIDEVAKSNARLHPELDLNLQQLETASDASKKSLAKVDSNMYRYFKAGTVIALSVGAVVLVEDWVRKSLEARKGCYMVQTIDRKTTSCKVTAWSCIGSGGTPCSLAVNRYHNVTLSALQIATLADTEPVKLQVAAAVGVSVGELQAKLRDVIDNRFPQLTAVIATVAQAQRLPAIKYCEVVHSDIEGGRVPPCRMCDPAADPTSTTFIDPEQLSESVTFHCETNPTVLSLLADVAKNTARDVLEGLGSGLTALLKPLGILALVLLVLAIVISVAVYTLKRMQRSKAKLPPEYEPLLPSSAPPPPPLLHPSNYGSLSRRTALV